MFENIAVSENLKRRWKKLLKVGEENNKLGLNTTE
jgi:hypothetical protein